MSKLHTHSLAEAVNAAHAWWLEAGVDCDFTNEPRNWLERTAREPQPQAEGNRVNPRPAAPSAPQASPMLANRSEWPTALADFAGWWCTDPLLETPGTGQRLAPRGVPESELMVLVARPEQGDSGALLSGPEGQLVSNMLRAMGIADNRAYIAAALPRFVSHPDWAALGGGGLGEILRHLVALARPRRLLILGRQLLPLFEHGPAQDAAPVQIIALEGVAPPVLVAVDPETLLRERRFRAALWKAWLEWTEGAE